MICTLGWEIRLERVVISCFISQRLYFVRMWVPVNYATQDRANRGSPKTSSLAEICKHDAVFYTPEPALIPHDSRRHFGAWRGPGVYEVVDL